MQGGASRCNGEDMQTGWSRPLVVAALCAGALLVPDTAGAQSLGPQVSVSVTRGPGVRECMSLHPDLQPCGLLGVYKATVTWASACAPGLSDDARQTKVTLLARPPAPTEFPYGTVGGGDDFGDVALPATGSAGFALLPGWKVYASATVRCTEITTPPEEGAAQAQPEPRSEEATAESGTISAPPRLAGVVRMGGTYCIRPPQTPQSVIGKLQAGQTSWVRLFTRFATNAQHPEFGNPGRTDAGSVDPKRVWLYARGAGVNLKVRPARFWLKRGALEMKVRPKRAGSVKMWVAVDGVRTNAKSMRVVRGC